MKEELVSFETAKLAKEKGFKFNEEDEDFYKYSGCYKYGKIGFGEWSLEYVYDIETLHWGSELTEIICVPTQSLLQKWLREVHGLYVSTNLTKFGGTLLFKTVLVNKDCISYFRRVNYISGNSYEKELEIGLFSALEFIP